MELKKIAHFNAPASIIFEDDFNASSIIHEFKPHTRILVLRGLTDSDCDERERRSTLGLSPIKYDTLFIEDVHRTDDSLVLSISSTSSLDGIPIFDIVPESLSCFLPQQLSERVHETLDEPVAQPETVDTPAQTAAETAPADETAQTGDSDQEQGQDQELDDTIPSPSENPGTTLIIPLIIGVICIIIASVAFISSIWGDMSNAGRVLSMLPFVAVFFGAFAISHFKLKLASAAKAFYLLGTVAAAFTIIAFELLYLRSNSSAISAGLILPCACVMLASVAAYLNLYRSAAFEVFAWIGGYGVLASTMTALCEFSDISLKTIAHRDDSLPWMMTTLVCSAVFIFLMLTKRSFSKSAHVCVYLALAASTFFWLLVKNFGFEPSSLVLFAVLAALSLSLKKYPGIILLLSTWTLNLCISVDLADGYNSPIPDWIAIVLCPTLSVGLAYLMPILGKTLTPLAHNKVFWVSLVGLCISIIAARLEGDLLPMVYLIPAIISLVTGIKLHSTRYVIAFGVLSFFIGITLFADELDEISGWIYMLIIGAILIGLAIVNEVKHRQGESLIQKIKGSENSLWKW